MLANAAAAPRWEWSVGLVVALGFGLYLFASEYHHLFYDSADYWQLGHRFYHNGRFDLLAYDDALRGYAYPLFNLGCLAVRKALGWSAVTVVKLVNAALAGLLFGVVGPRLWQASIKGAALPSVGRRLLFAGLGLLFWRGYFNFSLSDFPALLALAAGLWLVQQPGWGRALAGGAALALALNIRPIYLAAMPPALLLLLWQQPRAAWPARLGALAVGAALVLTPQALINRRHFAAATPLVLSQSAELGIHDLYLQKLKWGLLHEKYESSVGRELPTGQVLFYDAEGTRAWSENSLRAVQTPWQYLALVGRHPLRVTGIYGRHLFAGLDISQPTPYLRRWAPARPLQLLGYALWFAAAVQVLGHRPSRRAALVLAALLLPCAAVIPLSMESRFLLPLHLLLLALVAFGHGPRWALGGKRVVFVGAVFIGYLLGCRYLSRSIEQAVEPRFRPFVLSTGTPGHP